MSKSQDFLLDLKYDTQGEALLDQSADREEEPMEEEVINVEEVLLQPPEPAEPAEPVDSGCMLACGERDIFDEDASQLYTVSQLVEDLNSQAQEDLKVPAHSPEVEEALKPVPIKCWASESEEDSTMNADMEGQDVGQEDPCLPSQSVEPIPLGQGCSRKKFE